MVKLTKAISHFVSNVIKYYCNPTFPKYQNEYMYIICNYWLATSENNTSNLSNTLKMFIEKLYLMRDIHLFILNQYLSLQRDGWSNTSMLPFLGINVSFIVNTDTKGEQWIQWKLQFSECEEQFWKILCRLSGKTFTNNCYFKVFAEFFDPNTHCYFDPDLLKTVINYIYETTVLKHRDPSWCNCKQ